MTAARHPVVALPPTPQQFSLLSSSIRPDANEVGADGLPVGARWEEGFTWLPRQCPGLSGRNECAANADVSYRDKGAAGRRSHQPVILSAVNECPTTFGLDWPYEQRTAFESLVAGESAAAEAELADGVLARAAIAAGDTAYDDNLWLSKFGVAEVLNGTGVTPLSAISICEAFLGATGTGAPGMIHLSPRFVPHVGVRQEGGRLLTLQNNILVPGGGYTGNGPAASDGGAPVAAGAGTAWVYCTGLVRYRNGPIVVTPTDPPQGIDRHTNTVAITAQRSSAATWDLCAVGAVLVNLPA